MAVPAVGLVMANGALASDVGTAEGPTHKCYYIEDVKGWGCFQPYGDHIFVQDSLWEGQGVQVYWETDYGRSDTCRDSNGTSDGVKDCNYNMREDGELRFRLQLTDDGSIVDETSWSGWIDIG